MSVVVVNSRISCSSYLQPSLSAAAARRPHHVSTTSAIVVSVTTPITSLHVKPPQPILKQRGLCMIVKAASSSEIDGIVDSENAVSSETVKEEVPIEKLPLESKIQLMLEQKEKMKLAKKIRLRRKRLVQKRQMRKKGRWPPSKMKKNKNV